MRNKAWLRRTELLLDDLENFLLVKFLWETLDGGQSLATITLCDEHVSIRVIGGKVTLSRWEGAPGHTRPRVGRSEIEAARGRGTLGRREGGAGLNTYAECVYGCNSESV